MFRSAASKPLLRSVRQSSITRASFSAATASRATATSLNRLLLRPQSIARLSLPQHSVTSLYHATAIHRKDIRNETIKHRPESVTPESTTRAIFDEPAPTSAVHNEEDMMAGIKQDMKVIKETFALDTVPKESYYLGAAGVLPYATTSLATVYLAYDVNHAAQHGEGFLVSPQVAMQLLEIITPIQIGFGAVIISFLGAIHWGLEYAAYGGHQGYRRYMYGVLAPAVAWPTLLMPVETALITQFLAFTFQYFADARATVAGWCPPWYSAYRFVLTFFVGASIVITLIGRGEIAGHDIESLQNPVSSLQKDRDYQWEALEREEVEKQRRLAEEEEEAEDEDEESDDAEDADTDSSSEE